MKRIFRNFFLFVTIICLIASSVSLFVSAASTTYGIDIKNPKVGDKIVITVTLNSGVSMLSTEAKVSVDESILSFKKTGTSVNQKDGFIQIIGLPQGDTKQSYNLEFTVIGTGTSPIKIYDVYYSPNVEDTNAADVKLPNASGNIIVSEPQTPPDTSSTPSDTSSTTPSSNANLASLKVSGGTLSPKFNANTTNYTVTVDNDVEKTTVSATSADKDAKINGTGNVKLSVGDNKRVITVTASDGTKKVYNITIRRLAEGEEAETDGQEDNENTVSSDPYGVMIDGELYRIESELSDENAPIGYTKTEIAYNGTVVPVYTDAASKMMLYSIKKDGAENADFYIYDVTDKKFKKIEYLQTADRFYLFAEMEENLSAPAGFFEKNIEIGDVQIKGFVYKNSLLSDFAVVYCYAEGKYGYYRYDKKENTLQRLPEFTPVVSQKVNSNINQNKPESKGLLDKFSSFKTEAKVVIIAIIIAAISVIGLIILFIIYLFKRRDDDVKEGAFTTADYSYEVEDAQPFNNVENGVEPENNNDNTKK